MRFHTEEIPSGRRILHGLAGATLIAVALFLTNPYFSILEDETSIIVAANAPISRTLAMFAKGEGQHEHPPLSDLLLHFWLPVAGMSPSLVRLPSIVLYSFGVVTFAAAAQMLSGVTAFYATMAFGMLWPFGFHFGRLAGWYSLCFLLVGLITLSYLYFLVVFFSFAAVISNYFCWLVVAVIILDVFLTLERRLACRYAAGGLGILFVGYEPVWISFAREVQRVNPVGVGHGMLGTVLNAGFNLYAIFISESVAPWYWIMSIPAGVAIAVVLISTPCLIEGRARRFYYGFAGLFGIMAALGIIGTKRLLFISGWLLLGIGCALGNSKSPRLRALLALSLLVTIAIGWTGIFSRKYYASLHFVEPWAVLAREAAQNVGRGEIVISNSPSFLFYLNASLHELRLSANQSPGWAAGPNVISLLQSEIPESLPAKEIMFVRGVNTSATRRTSEAEKWLGSHCRLESADRLLHDDGFEQKKRYFKLDIDDPYRICVEQFDCRDLR